MSKPIAYTKEYSVFFNLRGPGIIYLYGTDKRFETIAQAIARIGGLFEPVPRPEQIIGHIGKIGREQDVALGRDLIVQPAIRLDKTIAGDPQEVMAEKGYEIVAEIIAEAPKHKIKGGHPRTAPFHPAGCLGGQAQGRKKGDHRAQTRLGHRELPEIFIEIRGKQIEVEV